MNATAAAGCQLAGYRSELLDLQPAIVLEYVRNRLAAPTSFANRVKNAAAVLLGTAEKATITMHAAPLALRDGPPEITNQLVYGPDGPASLLTLQVVDIAVQEWILPAKGDSHMCVAWVMTGSTAGPDPGFFPVPKHGLVVLPAASGALADAVREFEHGAHFWSGGAPAYINDPRGEVLAAIKWWQGLQGRVGAARLDAARVALTNGSGPLLQLAIDVLVEFGPNGIEPLAAALAAGKHTSAAVLALRAALWKLDAKQAATQDLDLARLDADALNAFGLVMLPDEQGNPWALQGPPPDSRLAPEALCR